MYTKKSTGEFDAEMAALRDDVKPEWYENWYDGLGYCKAPESSTARARLDRLLTRVFCGRLQVLGMHSAND
jgi:hypothetical protein